MWKPKSCFFYRKSIKQVLLLYVAGIPDRSAQRQEHLIGVQQTLSKGVPEMPSSWGFLDTGLLLIVYLVTVSGNIYLLSNHETGHAEVWRKGLPLSIKAGFSIAQTSSSGFSLLFRMSLIQYLKLSPLISARVGNLIRLRLKSLKNSLWCTWKCAILRNKTL